jgi:hypothetical protein
VLKIGLQLAFVVNVVVVALVAGDLIQFVGPLEGHEMPRTRVLITETFMVVDHPSIHRLRRDPQLLTHQPQRLSFGQLVADVFGAFARVGRRRAPACPEPHRLHAVTTAIVTHVSSHKHA